MVGMVALQGLAQREPYGSNAAALLAALLAVLAALASLLAANSSGISVRLMVPGVHWSSDAW